MKAITLLIMLIPMLFFTTGVISQTDEKSSQEVITDAAKVEVYYFHNTRRCQTCNAVEEVTVATIKEYYSKQYDSGEITFQSLNLEEDSGEEAARELKVSGQTLLIIKDGKKKDLTNDAFMYAKSKPEKLKDKIHKVIGTI